MGVGWPFAYREAKKPLVDSQWKFELKGFATVERATPPSGSLTVTMGEEAAIGSAASVGSCAFPLRFPGQVAQSVKEP